MRSSSMVGTVGKNNARGSMGTEAAISGYEAQGAACAELVFKDINQRFASGKNVLMRIHQLGTDFAHIAFRAALDERVRGMKTGLDTMVSKKDKALWTKARDVFKVQISNARRFSEALSAGWVPDMSWSYAPLIAAAGVYLRSKADAKAAKALGGRPSKPIIDKVRDFLVKLELDRDTLAQVAELAQLMQDKRAYAKAEKERLAEIEAAKEAEVVARDNAKKAAKKADLAQLEVENTPPAAKKTTGTIHNFVQPRQVRRMTPKTPAEIQQTTERIAASNTSGDKPASLSV